MPTARYPDSGCRKRKRDDVVSQTVLRIREKRELDNAYTFTPKCARDFAVTRARQLAREEPLPTEPIVDEGTPLDVLMISEMRRALDDCVARLTASDAELVDYYQDRVSWVEVANIRKRSAAAIRKAWERTRTQLGDCLTLRGVDIGWLGG